MVPGTPFLPAIGQAAGTLGSIRQVGLCTAPVRSAVPPLAGGTGIERKEEVRQ